MTEPSDSNEEIRWDGAMPCDQWVEYAKECLKPYFEREVVVVSLVCFFIFIFIILPALDRKRFSK